MNKHLKHTTQKQSGTSITMSALRFTRFINKYIKTAVNSVRTNKVLGSIRTGRIGSVTRAPLLSRFGLVVFGILVILAQFLSITGPVNSAPIDELNFQARLLTDSGALVPDGTYNVEFKLYDSLAGGASAQGVCVGGGTDDCQWLETRTGGNQVSVTNGYLYANLGSVTAFGSTIDWSQELWLTINIGGTGAPSWDGEMSPRVKLTSVPHAFNSELLDNLDSTDFVQLGQGVQTDATTNSSIFINKTSTGDFLSLQDGGTEELNFNQNAELTLGSSSDDGALVLADGNGESLTITSADLTSDYTLTFNVQGNCSGANGGVLTIAGGEVICDDDDGGGAAPTLQSAYNNGNNITTTTARDIEFDLASGGTEADFIVDLLGTGNTFEIRDGGNQALRVIDGGDVVIGDSTTDDGTLVFENATNSNTLTLVVGATSTNTTLTLPTADGNAGQCLKDSDGSGTLAFANCNNGSGSGGAITLDDAYEAGNLLDTSDNNDVDFILSDDTTDSNFDIDIEADNTVSISRIDTSSTEVPSQLLLLENLDSDITVVDALDISGSNITNAINIGANAIAGTNFSVTGAGAITGVGLTTSGGVTVSGVALDITTGSGEDLDLQANGAGIIHLDDTVRIGSLDCSGDANGGALTTNGSGDIICSDDDGGGSTPTLQNVYDADDDDGIAEIILTSTDGEIVIRDAASTIGDLFVVEADGGADYLAVASTGITAGTNVTVTAGNSLTLVGGNTASRPGSPSEGEVYFDSETDNLLVYSNGKWQAYTGEYVIVAADDSTQAEKDSAHYVADGTDDQVEINNALTAASGGKVLLLAGTYVTHQSDNGDASIEIPNNTTLQGVGLGTVIELGDLDATDNLIENTDASTGTGVVVRDLTLDGRDDLNTAGTQNAIRFNDVGDGSGAGAREGGIVQNVYIEDFRNDGIYLNDSDNNYISNVTIERSAVGIFVTGSVNNIIENSNIKGNSSYGIRLTSSSTFNVISGIISENNNTGVDLNTSDYNTISDSQLNNNSAYGLHIRAGSDYNTATGNVIEDSGSAGLFVDGADNVISNNSIYDSNGNSFNNGIYITAGDRNNVIGNVIGDTSCSTNCYAINITAAGAANNYVADNIFDGGGTFNDGGTDTVVANQLNGDVDTATSDLDITAPDDINLNSDTFITGILDVSSTAVVQGASLTIGTTSQAGSLILHEDTNDETVSIATGVQSVGSYSVSFPELDGNDTFCLVTEANCTGSDSFTTVTYDDGSAENVGAPTLDFQTTDFAITESPADEFNITIQGERVEDLTGAMVTGNTETDITVTYQDGDGTLDFIVDTLPNLTGTLDVDSGGTGVATITAGGVLFGNGTGAITNSGVLANGELLIGDGSGAPSNATLTGGTAITVTNGAGSIDIGVTADSIGDTQLAFDTGQALTTSSTPTFVDLLLQDEITFEGTGVDANETILAVVNPTADITYQLADAAAGTYEICTEAGNCSGVAGNDLQQAYDASGTPATIDLATGKNLEINLTNVAADPDFIVDIATGSTGVIELQNNGTADFRVDSSGVDLLDVDVADFTGSNVTFDAGEITNTELANSSLTYTAGTGLTGGGLVSLGGSATINVGGGTCLTANADDIAITADCIDDAQIADNSIDATSLAPNSVDSSELVDGGVDESHLNITNAPSGLDNYVLTFNEAGGNFTWVDPSTIGSDSFTTVTYDDGSAENVGAPTLDFDTTDFAITESPADEFNITIEAERIQDIAGAMLTGNTETGITVVYQDGDGTIDFTVDNLEDLAGTLDVASGGTGATTLTDGGILFGNGTGAIGATGVLANGQLLIGDGSEEPTLATLTGGTAITVTNGAGSIDIGVTADSIGDSQLAFNTGQHLTTADSPTFTDLNLQDTITFEGTAADANETVLSIVNPTADITYELADEAAGTYEICTTAGNCSGVSGNNLQQAYDADDDDGIAEIILTSTDGEIVIRDAASTIGDLFVVEADGGTDYLAVASTGITAGTNVTVTAGNSLTLVGGNTASRPGSPSEGEVYFDSETDNLLVYSNGKWQAYTGEYVIVAADDSTQAEKDSAHYVADGTSDEDEINSALTAASGGKVLLLAGTYVADATILIPNNTTLQGVGHGTVIELADIDATDNLIENSDTSTGTGVVIRDLTLDGRDDLNTTGIQYAIDLEGMGSGEGASAVEGATVTNIYVTRFGTSGGRGIFLDSSDNNTVTNSVFHENQDAIYISSSQNIVVSDSRFTDNHQGGGVGRDVYATSSEFIVIDSNYFDSAARPVSLSSTTHSVVSSNSFQDGFYFNIEIGSSSDYNSITGNVLEGSGSGDQILVTSADYNVFSGNASNDANDEMFIVSSSHNNEFVGNVSQGDEGFIDLDTSDSNTVVGNAINGSTQRAIRLDTANRNVISNNSVTGTGQATYFDAIYLVSADENVISSNNLNDTNCITTCYAINITDSGSDDNYLSNNTFKATGGDAATINDSGTGTIYANQLNEEIDNATADLDIQAPDDINLNSDTVVTGTFQVSSTSDLVGEVTVGDDSTGGSLRLGDGSSNYLTFTQAALGSNYSVAWNVSGDCTGSANGGALTINGSNQIVCSDDAGAGAGNDLQGAYDAGSDGIIQLDGTRNGIFIQDASSTVGDIFVVENDTGATDYLTVTNSTTTVNGDLVVTAGNFLSLTGGNTASRPGSPSEGDVYFDTDTDQLLVYSNGKWKADSGEYTIVAANDSTDTEKASAHYVADGTADESEINSALTAATGGKVVLLAGTYSADATILVPNNTTLQGVGTGTVIASSFGVGTDNLIEVTGASRTGQTIRDLALDGSEGTGGTQMGIFALDVGATESDRAGVTIENVHISGFRTHGIELDDADLSIVTNNTVQNVLSFGINIEDSDDNVVADNVLNIDTGTDGLVLDNSDRNTVTGNVSINSDDGFHIYNDSDYNSIVGNTASGHSSYGFRSQTNNSNNTYTGNVATGNETGFESTTSLYDVYTGNVAEGNTNYGFEISTSSHFNTIDANSVSNNGVRGIWLNSTNDNIVSGNNVYDNGGATTNEGIYIGASDRNTIIGNHITDTSCSTTCRAINIVDSNSDDNYLADNTFDGGGVINDAGTGTVYANQLNEDLDSATADLDLTAPDDINLNSDTVLTGTLEVSSTAVVQGASLTVGTTSQAGSLILHEDTNNETVTINTGTQSVGSYSVSFPELDANDTFCLVTEANCAGSGISGSGTAGQVAFWDGASSVTGTAQFTWDDTNNILDIRNSDAFDGNPVYLYLTPDNAGNTDDQWIFQADDGGYLSLINNATTILGIDDTGQTTFSGWIDDDLTIRNDDVNSGIARLYLQADNDEQVDDEWTFQAEDGGLLSFINNSSTFLSINETTSEFDINGWIHEDLTIRNDNVSSGIARLYLQADNNAQADDQWTFQAEDGGLLSFINDSTTYFSINETNSRFDLTGFIATSLEVRQPLGGGEAATLLLAADNAGDATDTWTFEAGDNGELSFINNGSDIFELDVGSGFATLNANIRTNLEVRQPLGGGESATIEIAADNAGDVTDTWTLEAEDNGVFNLVNNSANQLSLNSSVLTLGNTSDAGVLVLHEDTNNETVTINTGTQSVGSYTVSFPELDANDSFCLLNEENCGVQFGSGAAGQVAYWTAADTLDGENNFYWDAASDELGLGTTSPSANLHIRSTGDAGIRLEADTDNSNENDNPYIYLSQDNNAVFSSIGHSGGADLDALGNALTGAISNALIIEGDSSGDNVEIQLATEDVVALTVSATQQIGIGDTTPEALLDVQGAEGTDAVILLDADDGDNAADSWELQSEAADNDFSIVNATTERLNLTTAGILTLSGYDCSSGDQYLTTDASGTLACGTDDGGSGEWSDGGTFLFPGDLTGAEDIITGGETLANADIILYATGAATFNEQGANADFLIEGDTDTELFFVDADAESVGIGTTSPGHEFHVTNTSGGTTVLAVEHGFNDHIQLDVSGAGANVRFGSGLSSSTIDVGHSGNLNFDFGAGSSENIVFYNAGGAIFNQQLNDSDFQVSGDNDANLLYVDAGNDRLGVGTATPDTLLDVDAGTAGDAALTLQADSDNNDENDNPYIEFIQDGGNEYAMIGLAANSGTGPDGTSISYLSQDAFAIIAEGKSIDFATGSGTPAAKLRIDGEGRLRVGLIGSYAAVAQLNVETADTGKIGAQISGFSSSQTGDLLRVLNNPTDEDQLLTIAQDGAATFRVDTDGQTVFTVQEAGGQDYLTVDTENSTDVQKVAIGEGSDDVVFTLDSFNSNPTGTIPDGSMFYDADDDRFMCRVNGTWENCDTTGSGSDTIAIGLSPEFGGGTLVADGSSNNGTMSAGHVTSLSSGQGYKHNYYQWTSSQGSSNDYDIVINYKLPSDFNASNEFNTSSWKVWTYSDSLANTTITMTIEDQDLGTACVNAENIETTTVSTWEEITLSTNPNTNCVFSAGDIITITIKMGSQSNANVRLGEIEFEYDT